MMRRAVLLVAFVAMSVRATEVRQIFRPERIHAGNTNVAPVQPIDDAAWIWMPGHDRWGCADFVETRPTGLGKEPSDFFRFRREFVAVEGSPLRLDVSADERFVLLLDGEEVARGPHRGMPKHWNYQTYEISMNPGSHVLEAVCWQLGAHAPLAQMSVRGGFILKAEEPYDSQLTTGKAEWKVARLVNTSMTDKGNSGTFGVGSQCEVSGTSFMDEMPTVEEFLRARVVRKPVTTFFGGLVVQGWMLFPTTLPDQMHERMTPGSVRNGPNVLAPGFVVPAGKTIRAYWDLGDYFCAYPELVVSGGRGAVVKWGWTESLRDEKGLKGDRAAVEGKEFTQGMVDTFRCDGRTGAKFTTPWWRCGRWCMVEIATADEPLAIDRVSIAETRYPVRSEAVFECSDASLGAVQKICVRGMQACMHEMFFDCPFYEQQMYPGDSRVQFLVAGVLNRDYRLVRNSISLYDWDRRESGMVAMNFPTRGTQESATYTMCWILMLRDYMMNHSDAAWLRARLPGMTHTLMGFAQYEGSDGLLRGLPGWCFVDWVPEWRKYAGVPPDGQCDRPNAIDNLFYLYSIRAAADVADALDEPLLAVFWRDKAERLRNAIESAFWDDARCMVADTLAKDCFSEHAQCLAILADALPESKAESAFRGLTESAGLARTTVYFSHYLFDAYLKRGRADMFLRRLDLWRDYVKMHLCTPLEMPGERARSDCHAWGSHPLYHLHTGVAGVKSAAPFFSKVLIAPQPAGLKWLKAKTPHPQGMIEMDLAFSDGKAVGVVTLPGTLSGLFRWNGQDVRLHPGRQEVAVDGASVHRNRGEVNEN